MRVTSAPTAFLLAASFAVTALHSHAQNQGKPSSPHIPVWRDTNGVVVGVAAPVIGPLNLGGTITGGVLLPYSEDYVVFPLRSFDTDTNTSRAPGMQWLEIPIFWSKPNCSGVAYIWPRAGIWGSARVTAIQRTSTGAYMGYIGAAKGGELIPYSSQLANGGSCSNYVNSADHLFPVEATVPLDTLGQQPFYLR